VQHDAETERLRQREAALNLSPETLRALGHRLVDEIADFLQAMPRGPVNRDETPAALQALLPRSGLPEEGRDAASLLAEVTPLLFAHSLFNGHPRFFGYITGSPAPIGMLADLLAAAVNPNCGGWQLSPMAAEIERQSVRWIGELLDFPVGAGLMVSGGNMANFVAFLAARRARGGEGLRREGLAAAGGPLTAYVSTETHTWIEKATDLFGHGTESVRWIPAQPDGRMDLAALHAQLHADRQAGQVPFLLVGNGGTVGTGAVDPLNELADIARDQGLWLHVDGAYGGFAVVAPEAPPALRALSRADSVAVDPHKWLYAPLEAGCVLVRDPQALSAAFRYTPSYYRFSGDTDEGDPPINYYEQGFQNSRGFRALKVWLGLRQAGRAGYARMIGDDIRLARALQRIAGETPEIEVGPCGLSIATWRFVPRDLVAGEPRVEAYLNALNEALLARIKASGELFVSNTMAAGRFLLRACIVNFRTTLDDIEALPAIVVRHGRLIDASLRPPQLGRSPHADG
jgi:glutamate/tyrosine decarboxylase-like PLP-dependent enzyme